MDRSTRFVATVAVIAAAVFAPASQAMTRIVTGNSPSQKGLGQSLVYVHSPGLNAPASPATVSFATENSASQNRVSLLNAAETGSLGSGSTFDWGDAGIGAGTVGGVLLLVGAATLAVLRRNGGRRLAL